MSRWKLVFLMLVLGDYALAQSPKPKTFTRADTLRGSITPERAWWDVQKYDITVKPDFTTKTTAGSNVITYKVLQETHPDVMQIDLQAPLHIDSVLLNHVERPEYKQDGNVWYVKVPSLQRKGETHTLQLFFSGTPKEGIRPPWIGGWTFTRDSLNRPWMTVTCQGLGASVWYPCKDHQSDEPDHGASLTMIVPDTLVAVANGRMKSEVKNQDGTATYTWEVINPINNYDIIPYIGKYVNFKGQYAGEKGALDLSYWVLDYNLEKAKHYMPSEVTKMLSAFEYWMGPYPFYEDGYKLIDAPHTGMEHQSGIAYGNWYKPGYRLRDASGTGLGMKWDFIIVHESGHEWFGNNITSNDLADMWIHESFTNYSETLYVDYHYGKEAGDAYNQGIRNGIRNDNPIIGHYGVNEEGSGDMYPKGGNMLHTIRHSMDNDQLFRNILRGLNKTFYHRTVDADQIEQYVSGQARFNYKRVFDQYLLTTQVPELKLRFNKDRTRVSYQWVNCLPGFNLPIVMKDATTVLKLYPQTTPKTVSLKKGEASLLDPGKITRMYYVKVS